MSCTACNITRITSRRTHRRAEARCLMLEITAGRWLAADLEAILWRRPAIRRFRPRPYDVCTLSVAFGEY